MKGCAFGLRPFSVFGNLVAGRIFFLENFSGEREEITC